MQASPRRTSTPTSAPSRLKAVHKKFHPRLGRNEFRSWSFMSSGMNSVLREEWKTGSGPVFRGGVNLTFSTNSASRNVTCYRATACDLACLPLFLNCDGIRQIGNLMRCSGDCTPRP